MITFKKLNSSINESSIQATKQMKRIEKLLKDLFKSELSLNGKLSMTVNSQFSATYEFSYDRVMDNKSFDIMIKDVESVIRRADEEGHVNRVIDSSANPAEVLLHSLRPGMTVKAEAFFPTISFTIEWKRIVKR
jgi:hypothetical protein